MLETIKSIDTRLLLAINGHHSPFFDQVMWLASDKFVWIPLYALFLWLIYSEHRRKFWMVLLAIALMVTVSDQMCNLFKESFMRFRPSNEPALKELIHLVNDYSGGSYGFYSSHASNSFSVAVFTISLVRKYRKWLIPVAFSYAILVSFSRIYLGVHYPGDVLTGAVAGSLIGWGMSILYLRSMLPRGTAKGKTGSFSGV